MAMLRLVRSRTGVAVAALAVLAVLIVWPLILVLIHALFVDGQFAPMKALSVWIDRELLQILANSLLLGLLVVAGSSLLAFPMAFLAVKTSLSRHRWLDVVLIVPFMTPPYIGSMGWILFMQRQGFLEQMLPFTQKMTPYFFSLFGLVAIMSLHLYPFLYLIIKNALLRIGAGYEEAAAVHSAGLAYRFRKVVLPLLFGSYAMGALLVFVKTIAEFGTPATFGRRIGFYVLTTEIHRYTSSWPIDFGKATALASLLLSVCLLFWYMQSILSRKFQYQTLGGKGMKRRVTALSGWKGVLSWGYVAVLLGVSIGVPYFSVVTASLQKLRGDGLAWGNYTLAHYATLLEWGGSGMKALFNSATLALAAATVAAVIGLFLAIQIQNGGKRTRTLIDMFSLMPNMVPGIVLVVGLILLWNASWMPIPLYNTKGMALLTYIVLFLPYSVTYVKSSLSQLDDKLLQAGRVFGGSRWYVFRRVLLPLLIPGILAGWVMTFTISVRELVASLMILPPSMQVTATFIYSQFEQGDVSLGMAMAVVSVGFTTCVLAAMNVWGADRKG